MQRRIHITFLILYTDWGELRISCAAAAARLIAPTNPSGAGHHCRSSACRAPRSDLRSAHSLSTSAQLPALALLRIPLLRPSLLHHQVAPCCLKSHLGWNRLARLAVVFEPWGACRSCYFPRRMALRGQKARATSFQHCRGGKEIQCNRMIQRNHFLPVAHTHWHHRMAVAQS